MSNIQLEPCPYCGGNAEITSEKITSAKRGEVMFWSVHCVKCGKVAACTTDLDADGEKMIARSWNWESKRISAHKGR